MCILMILLFGGLSLALILSSTIKIGFGSAKKCMVAIHACLIAISIIIAGLSVGYSIHATNVIVGDAEEVGRIEPVRNSDSGNVYYDAETDEYFIIQSDVWNAINPVYRVCLDKDIASTYAEVYEQVVGTLNTEK